ncbi:MAG TPA: hypothetical protein VHY37_02305, partial [Tepidisphaeraceae bacterium]|nr:hypothetical protein [Tepidisphaeraceae bacterium]
LLVSAMAAVLGLTAVGCMPQANGVIANAPAPNPDLSGRIPATGTYILFRVNTENHTTGQPKSVTQIARYDLQEGDRVGFEWVPDDKSLNSPDAHMDLIAYAGSARENLGPITTFPEHYYFATKDGFEHYWSVEPAYGFYNRVTLQQ